MPVFRHRPYDILSQRRRSLPAGSHRDAGHDSDDVDSGDDGAHTGLRTLACPYYKRSPTHFTRCMFRNQLTSTSFVFQHLIRSHLLPIHCPTCGSTFEDASERNRHLRQQTCVDAGPIRGSRDNVPEGIDVHQLAELRMRPRRGLTEAERWFALWDILFPCEPQPASPYINSPEDEILYIARQAIERVCPNGISSQVLERLNWSTVSSALENPSHDQSSDQAASVADSLSSSGARTPSAFALGEVQDSFGFSSSCLSEPTLVVADCPESADFQGVDPGLLETEFWTFDQLGGLGAWDELLKMVV